MSCRNSAPLQVSIIPANLLSARGPKALLSGARPEGKMALLLGLELLQDDPVLPQAQVTAPTRACRLLSIMASSVIAW